MPIPLTWNDLELEATLGEGQSGTVVRATLRRAIQDFPAATQVAVKRYKRWVLEQPGQLERIFSELETGRSIRHPNLVQVLGAILDTSGNPALVMRHYDGPTLEAMLSDRRAHGPAIPIDAGFVLIRALASGIAELHRHSVIHRDIKPGNVLMTDAGPVLCDLGVVRSGNWPEQTTTGVFLGTIRYAAPEYLFGDSYDQRIDVYSLGAIAYEVFTGRQHLGFHRHWAKVVAAVASAGNDPLRIGELDKVAERSDLRTTTFVRDIIEHSKCFIQRRDLDLRALISAIDERAWTTEVRMESGRFLRGARQFDDRFGTARAAADFVLFNLNPRCLAPLRRVLRKGLWDGFVPLSLVPRDLFDELRHHSLGEVSKGRYFRLLPSLFEAAVQDFI